MKTRYLAHARSVRLFISMRLFTILTGGLFVPSSVFTYVTKSLEKSRQNSIRIRSVVVIERTIRIDIQEIVRVRRISRTQLTNNP